jgi:hypothetical protein
MRTLLLFVLLLPTSLFAQVKILMPVVVKDTAGNGVTDLKESDFKVSGPKNVRLDRMWLVPAEPISNGNEGTSVVMLFDLANARGDVPSQDLLERIAEKRMSVTILVNTTNGLQRIYDPATPPEVLSAALRILKDPSASNASPEIESLVEQLRALTKLDRNDTFRYDAGLNQMNTLVELARRLQLSEGRKALLWSTGAAYFSSSSYGPLGIIPPNCESGKAVDCAAEYPRSEIIAEALNAAHVTLYPAPGPQPGFYASSAIAPFVTLAQLTGGLTFYAVGEGYKDTIKVSSLWDALQKVLADFGSYYMLAVEAPASKETNWIPVKITVNRPGLTVRAAPGFLGLKPAKAK